VSLVGWETMQRQTAEGAVESEQRIVLASAAVPFDHAGAVQLGDRYWREVRRATWGLIRPRRRGKHLELRILGRGPPLLSFAEPSFEVMPRRVACRFPIAGGLLVQQPAGEISFAQTAGERFELRSAIRGFYPRLAARLGGPAQTGALYNAVQSRIHVAISRRYFARLAGEVTA
jgi:hypothetical protein